jgi:ferritin
MAYPLENEIKKLIDELLAQELYASYHYKSAFAWCSLKQYTGGTKFFLQESKDEQKHANILIEYATDYRYTPKMSDIIRPDQNFTSLRDVIERSLELECELGEKYEAAYKTALDICPLSAVDLFQQFLVIQSTAIREYMNFVDELDGYGDTPLGVKLFDTNVLGK